MRLALERAFLDTNNMHTYKTQSQGNMWVAVAITAAATALIVGAIVYFWQQNRIKNVETSFLQQQVEDLQNKLAADIATPSPTASENPAPGSEEPIGLVGPEELPTDSPLVSPKESPVTSAAPLNDPTDIKQLTQVFATKYSKPIADISVIMIRRDGKFAVGQVSLSPQPGDTGIWYAVKLAATWKVAYDGNGVPTCAKIDQDNFPVSIIDQCVLANGTIKKR